MPTHRSYSFGEHTLDISRGALLKDGADVRLRPKSFQVLQLLVERHGELVTKDELLDAVWGRTVVTEGSITQCLIDIRRALGDEAQQIIRTVPRRGYLFDIPVVAAKGVEASSADEAPSAAATTATEPSANTGQSSADTGLSTASSRRPIVLAAVLGVLAALVIGAYGWWHGTSRDPKKTAASVPGRADATRVPHNSIAVLPFVNMSPEPDQEFFSDGISEEILNLLAQGSGFTVIARTSSFAFKGRNLGVADIAQKLNVAYVLEGSVRKAGQRLRITAQLIDAANSAHLWSETYDRELEDAFAIQTEIAIRVADSLKARLTGDLDASMQYAPDAQAHERFLSAQFFYHRRAPGDIDLAQQYYEEAVGIDPGYARAWAGLAGVYGIQFSEGEVPVPVALEKRRAAVEQALASGPNVAEAHIRAAQHYWETGDGQRAADHAARALALDRDNPLVLAHYCTLLAWQDRFDDAIGLQNRMVARDPFSLVVHINLANTLLAAGRLDEARTEFLKAAEISPDWHDATEVELARILILEQRYPEALQRVQSWPDGADRDHGLALIYDAQRRRADADVAVQRLHEGKGPGSAVRLAEVHATRGNIDEAVRWIATAYERLGDNPWLSAEWQWVYPLRFSPFLKALHGDPRWAELRMRGLPPGTQAELTALPEQLAN